MENIAILRVSNAKYIDNNIKWLNYLNENRQIFIYIIIYMSY